MIGITARGCIGKHTGAIVQKARDLGSSPSELPSYEMMNSEMLGLKSAVVCFSRCLPKSSTDDERWPPPDKILMRNIICYIP